MADVLQSELKSRFIKYTAPGTADHNLVMLAATALDARYRLLLNPVQSQSAKKLLMEQVSVLVNLHDLACKKQGEAKCMELGEHLGFSQPHLDNVNEFELA